ncbi:hypothetical protein LJN55_04815 [Erwinia rhapontici]|uniref:hypothetical protein n=1 Tax=Erwinia TaxID=551 RepID=UPI001D0D8AE6|nr:hypothetical protein [Erwinia rhapontici]UDQ81186.1 hypothetical protein LJN55_04815 [Erwinia rhapontici]
MDNKFYAKYFSYSALFYICIYLIFRVSGGELDDNVLTYFLWVSVVNSVFFPFAVSLAEAISMKLITHAYWNRGFDLICIIFSVPMGLVWLVIRMKKNTPKK